METPKNESPKNPEFDLKKFIKALNQRPVAYYPIYSKLMSSVAGGVMLSQIMYWYSAVDGDEFFKSDADLKKETGLSEWEFKNSKGKLKSIGFVDIVVKGVPATTFYKIDTEKFAKILSSLEDVLQTGKKLKLRSKRHNNSVWSTSSKQAGSTSSKQAGSTSSKPHLYIENIQRVSEITAPKSGADCISESTDFKNDKKPVEQSKKELTEQQIIFGTIEEVCALDAGIPKQKSQITRFFAQMKNAKIKVTDELIRKRYGYHNGSLPDGEWNWYRNNYIGRQGQRPDPDQITKTWGNWEIIAPTGNKNGSANNKRSVGSSQSSGRVFAGGEYGDFQNRVGIKF